LPPGRPHAFLLQAGVSAAALEAAEVEARGCGAAVHEVLIASGRVSPEAYASALARWFDVPVAGWDAVFQPVARQDADEAGELGLPALIGGRRYSVRRAEDATPDELGARLSALRRLGLDVALASRFRFDAAVDDLLRAERLDDAVASLHRQQPAASAAGRVWAWQIVAGVIAVGLVAGGLCIAPRATIAALSGLIAVPFLCVALLRVVALLEVAAPREAHEPLREWEASSPEEMPVYSVLVPLFREVKVLPGLVQSLQALVYPKARLEVLLVLEAADLEMQAAALGMRLPANFRTVLVPEHAPQTKPKALNYALHFARGEFVVVYDAEDRPEPDQLLRALSVFRGHPPRLGCVQAQLNIYNPRASWLTRQFTIEYSALFDAVLPALARLGLPVPLGGTSNHLRREALVACGGWDPFNVTEDADLGFRLARQGWRTAMLRSTTWEEAPTTSRQWIRQRTRWLKGWMQTYLVHTRQPWRLNAELGVRGAVGFHALMGALILSALAHPLFYVLLACHVAWGELFAPADSIAGAVVWGVACANLGAGYVTSVLVGALSVWRRGRRDLVLSALFMPAIWLMMSAAAYRALYQLFRAPHLWEKTEHGMGQP
jgi:glycosyltransferase involved in cell wall biosynthesis